MTPRAQEGPSSAQPPGERDMRPVYVWVVVCEVLVLLGLWLFSRYFG